MSTLFEIVDEFAELYQLMVDGADEGVINGTLDSLTAELEVKSAGYVAVINQLNMEEKTAAELAQKYSSISNSRKYAIKKMKERLLIAMDALGKDEMPAGDFKIKVKKNGGAQPLKITGDVPESMMKITVENDSDKIREFLKTNTCDWAHLAKRGKHIEIK